jgi:hypothetical protein
MPYLDECSLSLLLLHFKYNKAPEGECPKLIRLTARYQGGVLQVSVVHLLHIKLFAYLPEAAIAQGISSIKTVILLNV